MMEILGQESVGSTMANLNQKVLLSVHVRLPPVEEQSRIIDAIDELMPDLKAGVDELAKAEKKLTTYRQSLLKAAVEGALTAEWRAQNPPKETGAELLFRILRARSEHWHGREAELANVKRPTRQRKSEYIEQVPAKELGSFDLPCGWTWAKVSTVGHVQLGRQRAPQFHRGDNMVPYLRVANVFEDRVDVSDVMSMHFSIDEQRTYTLTVGDILLNEGQSLELIGCPAIFRNELPRVCFTNSLVRFRVGQWVNAEYALIVFLHYMRLGRFRRIASITTNIAHLSAGRFGELEFPVPPMAEQTQIVSIFRSQQDQNADLESAVERSVRMAAAQRQNILRAAFSGQLVAQDPADEPSNVLLARMRAERAAQASAPKTRRPRLAGSPDRKAAKGTRTC